MDLDVGRSIVSPASDMPFECLHVTFGNTRVEVHSASPLVATELRDTFRPMLVDDPGGVLAGIVDVVPDPKGVRVRASPSADPPVTVADAWAPREAYHAVVKLLMLARPDLLWIHAGVVALHDRAAMFCAPSGQGKSTLVYALLRLGWTYLSDEVAAVDTAAGLVHPFPLSPRRRVHDGEFVLLDAFESVRELRKVPIDLLPHTIPRRPLPLARIGFLRFVPEASSMTRTAAAPGQAVLELLRNSLSIRSDREGEISRLARLVSLVPTEHLTYASAGALAALVHGEAAPDPSTA